MSYLLGVATPFALASVGLLIAHIVDRYKRHWISFEHEGCGWHEFRHWLPKPFLKYVLMPISVWRCNRGARIPLMSSVSRGRDYSNDLGAAS